MPRRRVQNRYLTATLPQDVFEKGEVLIRERVFANWSHLAEVAIRRLLEKHRVIPPPPVLALKKARELNREVLRR